jgi:hypothetical protein
VVVIEEEGVRRGVIMVVGVIEDVGEVVAEGGVGEEVREVWMLVYKVMYKVILHSQCLSHELPSDSLSESNY